MLSGFGTEDTHHILHTLRWGYDGMLYMNQSIYIHSHIETPWGPRLLNAGGIWQFRPETMQLEVFARGWINPWGHEFDRWGTSFVTDGAGGEGINYCVQGGRYVTATDAPRVLAGLNPGSPKYCGLAIVSGRGIPADWQGNLITNDFRAHRVCRFAVSESGAGYVSRELPELVKTNHKAFRPIDVQMGPDGAIYVADWYNPIIQHGEVDFRDPRRDHTHGRIWRITAKNRPAVAPPRLVDAADNALLDALKAPEDWTREQAHQVIKERGERMVPALAVWLQRLGGDAAKKSESPKKSESKADPQAASELDHQRLEALWAYQSLRHVEPGAAAEAAPFAGPSYPGRRRSRPLRLACRHSRCARAAGRARRRRASASPARSGPGLRANPHRRFRRNRHAWPSIIRWISFSNMPFIKRPAICKRPGCRRWRRENLISGGTRGI